MPPRLLNLSENMDEGSIGAIPFEGNWGSFCCYLFKDSRRQMYQHKSEHGEETMLIWFDFVQPSKARWWYLVHLGHVNEFRSVRQNDLSIHKTRTQTDQWPKNGWGIKKNIFGIKKIREDQKQYYGDQKIFQMLKISMILRVLLLDTRVLVRWMFERFANTMVEVEQIQSRAALRSSANWIHAWRANVAGTR